LLWLQALCPLLKTLQQQQQQQQLPKTVLQQHQQQQQQPLWAWQAAALPLLHTVCRQ
jgi:hypothetical protein